MCIETLHLDKRYRRVGGGCVAKLVDHVRCSEWIMGMICRLPETPIVAKLVG